MNSSVVLDSFFISTPYIDAYQHDWDDVDGSQRVPKVDYAGFVELMQSQAMNWGEQGVGRAALEGREPPMHDERYVLAWGTHGDKSYVAVPGPNWRCDVVEVSKIPHEWNVT